MGQRGKHGSIARAGLLAVAAALTLAVPPLAAAAKGDAPGKLKTRSATATLSGQNAIGTAVATCPKGTRAVGGGYATTPPAVIGSPSSVHIPMVFESFRLTARSWRVSAAQLQVGADIVTAYVYCREDFGKVKQNIVSTPIAAAARSEAEIQASCQKGSNAISGGFRIPAAANSVFTYLTQQEMVGPRSWLVHAVRGGITAPADGEVRSYVYCSKRVGAAEAKSAATTVTVSSGGDVLPTATTPSCDKPIKPVGGGFRAPYVDTGANRTVIFFTESQRVGRSWRASGYAAGQAGVSVAMTALAYCS